MASTSSSSSQQQQPSKLPTLGDAWRSAREAVSFTSTRVRHVTGVHHHFIDRYSKLAGMAVASEGVESSEFRAGGYYWQLVYYPKGSSITYGADKGHASAELRLSGGPWWRLFYYPHDVTAAYKVSILDADGNEAFSKAVAPQCFSSRWSRPGAEVVATAKEMSSALESRKDDGMVLRCDVTVMNLDKESRIKWYLRQLLVK